MIELNTIYNEDLLVTMGNMPDGFIDLTVTSPPYDGLRKYNGYSFDFEKVAKELYRVTATGGIVVWVVGDATIKGSETGTSFKQALFFMECGFKLHDTMIYKKPSTSFPDKNRYYQLFEYMFIFSKGVPKTTNLLSDKKNKWAGLTSFGNSSYREKDGTLTVKNKIKVKPYSVRDNIWEYATGFGYSTKDEIAFSHPAIFPEKLCADHIYSWSNEGDLVYDPFTGSGTTTPKMAHLQKRNWIASEISTEYVAIANKRIKPALLQTHLF